LTAPATLAPRQQVPLADAALAAGLAFLLARPALGTVAAALPLLDHFAAAHNLAALRDLAGKLTL